MNAVNKSIAKVPEMAAIWAGFCVVWGRFEAENVYGNVNKIDKFADNCGSLYWSLHLEAF